MNRKYLDLCFDAACLVDADGRLLHANEAFLTFLGMDRGETLGLGLAELVGLENLDDLERAADLQSEPGLRFKFQPRGQHCVVVDARVARVEGHALAVSFRPGVGRLAAEEAERMALHDALTGLPNRVLLLDRMRQTLARRGRHREFVAVLFLDLDGFKPVNDTYGHECGDQVLKVTAKRLVEAMRGGDTASRIGGDEFVLVLAELKNGLHAGLTANRLIKSVTMPVDYKDFQVRVSASMGISVAPSDGEEPEELLRKADEAMYLAKKSGKNGYAFHNESAYFD
ncbi:hypothetical protein JCM15519_14250 [Fundidesulfovibrio butyratiphilus]